MAEIVIRTCARNSASFTAVQGSSFTVADGEFFMLLGARPAAARRRRCA
jgi:multiple sugar transport system ATP-binding protein